MRVGVRFGLLLVVSLCAARLGTAQEPRAGATDIFAGLASLQELSADVPPREAQAVWRQEQPPAVRPVAAPPTPLPAVPPDEPLDERPWEQDATDESSVPEPRPRTTGADSLFGTPGNPPSAAIMAEHQPDRFETLYDRVLDLEPDGQNRRLIEQVRDATEATETGVDVTAEEWIHIKNNKTFTWGGRIQGDWVNWANDSDFAGQSNYVEFRRLRLFAAGEGYGVYDYSLELEFAPEVDLQADVVNNHVDLGGFGVELKDAFVGIRDLPRLGYVRFGHIKAPLNLEELTSNRFITFMERSLPHKLVPGRELGAVAYNHTLGQNATWAYGAFFDDLSEASHGIEDDSLGTRLVGRATWTPRYDEPSMGRYMIHTGLAYCYTRPRMRNNPLAPGTEFRPVEFDAPPEIHRGDSLIDTADINTQQYHLLNAELAWVHGPLSLQGELVWASLDRVGGGATDLYGAYAFASYFLTGEHRTYDRTMAVFDRVVPYENFWVVNTPRGRRAGWGAWELAARWSYLDFSDRWGQRLHDLTVGCNWYWNPQTRMMFNWIHPFASNSPVATSPEAEGDVLAMRLQVDF
ncbi:MAG: hypothetical protein JW809_19150 [Pirellulales bacterium]|nr:hypothetical protein [Pirellulales bacterium]